MMREKLTEEDWETFLGLADRLEIDLRTLLKEDVRFHELESAGHALGRAVAQATTERLAFAQAERLSGPQPCPTCGRAWIKEINFRVKGTEKFWNRPDGAENILQIRAAALCDDDRLSEWILNRPGSCFYRSTTRPQHPLATSA